MSRHTSAPSIVRALLLLAAMFWDPWGALHAQTGAKPLAELLDSSLPEPGVFLKQVAMTGDRYAALRQSYVCRTHLLVQPSKLAASNAATTQDYDSFFVRGREIHRLLAVDDHPLSEAGKEAESSRVEEEIHGFVATGKQVAAPAVTLEAAVLTMDVFTAERRTVDDGRSVISFHFQGDHRRKPRTILEMIARSLQGDVRIDEQDRAIVSMHGATRDDLIYNRQVLIPRLFHALVYEAKRVNDEIYVPSLVTIAAATRQPEGVTANIDWKRSLELRTYTVTSCEKFRVTSTILP